MKKDDERDPKRSRSKIIAIVGGLIGAAVITGGYAIAYWTAGGTGTGSAKALSAQSLTITATASPIADHYPDVSGTVQISVTNPNPYSVSLTGWNTPSVVSGDTTNCPSANVSVAASGTIGTPISVAGGGTPVTGLSIPSFVTMGSSAPNGCQGVTFTVTLTLTGVQT